MRDRSWSRSLESASLVAVASVLVLGCTRAGAQAASQQSPAGCVVRETSRTPLVVGDRELYVEPTVVLSSRDRILLAGRPNYLFARDRSPANPGITADSVFGAVLNGRGRPTLVPAPLDPALIADTRAIATNRGWAMVFAELRHPSEPPRRDTTARLWYGEFDGRQWGRLEELPQVPGGILRLEFASRLLSRGDTLLLAVPVSRDTATVIDVGIFRRAAGHWGVELVRARRASYAELHYSDSLGTLLFVVQPDPSLRSDVNSLLVYARRPGWEVVRTILPGGSQPIHGPRITASRSEPIVLTWQVEDQRSMPPMRRARAMIGVTETTNGRIVEVDPDVTYSTPVAGLPRFPTWVTEHNAEGGSREIRFITDSLGKSYLLGALPSPFTGIFAATASGDSDILVSGPLFQADSARPRLVSLLIRARVECRSGAP